MPGRLTRGVRSAVKYVEISVAAGATAGTGNLPPNTVEIVGHYPIASDQLVKSVVLAATGIITVTLAVAATAINKIRVTCV